MKRLMGALVAAILGVLIQFTPAFAVSMDFVSTWNTENITPGSSPTKSVTLPLVSNGTYNFDVNWGDGSSAETITSSNATHTYVSSGIYTITISGQIEGFAFSDSGDKAKLIDISNWGSLKLIDGPNVGLFQGANNFNASATDRPDTSSLTTLQSAFEGARSFNGQIGNWDVSHVTHMGSTFAGATAFNQDISAWDVSNVEIFRATFYEARAFNQDITGWNVSKGYHFGIMFLGASSFDQDLSGWDIASGGVAAGITTQLDGFLSGASISPTNYGRILAGWNTLTSTVTMQANSAGDNAPNQFDIAQGYPAEAAADRQALVDRGWVIHDGGQYVVPKWQIGRPNNSTTPVVVGSSASISVRYTNNTQAAIAVDKISVAGNGQYNFSFVGGGCHVTLASGEGCDVTLVFTPKHEGEHLINLRMHQQGDPSYVYDDSGDLSFLATGNCLTSGFAGGTGTTDDPYLISNIEQYGCINAFTVANGFYNYNKSFKLTADIDFGGAPENFVFISTWWDGFDGDFDGNGHTISGAVMNGTYAGMFPWVSGDANIKNFTLESPVLDADWYGGTITSYVDGNSAFSNIHVTNATVTSGVGGSTGGLIGYSSRLTLSNSSFSGTINASANGGGDRFVGGLVAYADGPSTLTNNSVDSDITYTESADVQKARVGGLVGFANDLTIEESIYTGAITATTTNADSKVGGFVGFAAGGSYSNNTATASVAGITDPAAIGLEDPVVTATGNTWNVTVASVNGGGGSDPSPSPSTSPSPSPSPSSSPSSSPSPSASPSPSQSQSPTPVVTPSPVVTPTLTTDIFDQLEPKDRAKRKVAEAPEALSDEDVQQLSADYLKVVPVNKLTSLLPEAFAALNGSQTKLLLAKQVQALEVSQLTALSPKAIAALRPTALAAIEPAKLKALSPKQKAAITKKQLNALLPAARKAIGR